MPVDDQMLHIDEEVPMLCTAQVPNNVCGPFLFT